MLPTIKTRVLLFSHGSDRKSHHYPLFPSIVTWNSSYCPENRQAFLCRTLTLNPRVRWALNIFPGSAVPTDATGTVASSDLQDVAETYTLLFASQDLKTTVPSIPPKTTNLPSTTLNTPAPALSSRSYRAIFVLVV